ncbi:uroporphyrin-III C-methyltransferase [Ancistrocladus abbreviatus]
MSAAAPSSTYSTSSSSHHQSYHPHAVCSSRLSRRCSNFTTKHHHQPLFAPRHPVIVGNATLSLTLKNYYYFTTSIICSSFSSVSLRSLKFVINASDTTDQAAVNEAELADQGDEEEPYQEYEVELDQPYGLRFAKGRDGATYIDAIAPGGSADKSGKFTVGDKVLATSAVFGTEIWSAAEYGRTMYTIRQRVGPLFMRMQKRYGKTESGEELTEKEIIRAERNSGVISNRVREIQLQNYRRKMEQKERREKDLSEALQLYRNGKYDEALEKFESVLGSKPTQDEASVASYNVACCYSKLNQTQAGLSALEDALEAGFEDFKRIRTDPDLANIRTSEEFEQLLKRFDESFINENAINAIKSLFGIFNKK